MNLDRSSLTEFFRDAIEEVQERRRVTLAEETQFYVVNLLAEFLATEKLYGKEDVRVADKPLALIYAAALEAENDRERIELFKVIGDRSLYVSGFFPDSFRRKVFDVDYYMAMGEQAYASVSDLSREGQQSVTLEEMYRELAEKFTHLVDLISELSHISGVTTDKDILRLYERWLHTGSARLLELLRAKGIDPVLCKKGPLH